MYLRTPKQYTKRGRRRHFSFKWLWLWIVAPVLIFIGVGIYQMRDLFIPQISRAIENVVQNAESAMATSIAPTPLPTQDPRDTIELADTAWRQGAIERAVSLYQQVESALPNDVRVHYRITLGLITSGKLIDALAAAEKAVNADPFSSDAWAIRAWALDWNRKPNEAIASALMALELNSDNARARAFLGEAYFSASPDQIQRALDTVNAALALDPNSFEAYRARGLIYQYGLFDRVAARSDYEAAYAIAPNMSYLAIDIAKINFELGNTTDAIALLRDVLDLNPDNTQALYWLGTFYFRGPGDYSQAAEYLTRCVDQNPNSIACNYMLGRAQWGLSQFSIAAESFAQTVALGSRDPFHYWWAGNAQIALGSCANALTYLRPGYEIARSGSNTTLIADYEAIMRDCQVSFVPTATPEAEDG